MLANTLVLVTSDNGASQEGGPLGYFNSAGPRNLRAESLTEKLAHIDDVGGPQSHNYLPLGWAMAANTPLRRYKQNTHGGGKFAIRSSSAGRRESPPVASFVTSLPTFAT